MRTDTLIQTWKIAFWKKWIILFIQTHMIYTNQSVLPFYVHSCRFFMNGAS